jgi:CheY-like chemotaxis protein
VALPSRPAGAGTSRRVLVAQNEPRLRHRIASALRGDGYEVLEAASGAESLDLIFNGPSDSRLDLIISSVRMPIATGVEVVVALRQIDRTLPVILMAARGDDSLDDASGRLGVRVFHEPFDLDDLRLAASLLT